MAEIGSGGGRVAAQVAEKVGRLVCFDISETMLKTAQKKLQEMHGNVPWLAQTLKYLVGVGSCRIFGLSRWGPSWHLFCRPSQVDFHLLQGDAPYPARFHETFDVVYSFDVFVHMDLHEMRHTLTCIQSILRPGGPIPPCQDEGSEGASTVQVKYPVCQYAGSASGSGIAALGTQETTVGLTSCFSSRL